MGQRKTSTIAANGKFLLESIGNSAIRAAFLTSPMMMRSLAIGAVHIGKLFSDDDSNSPKSVAPIHIENLTINITAEVVQQLNMNPEEVINQLTEQIQQTSLKAIAETNNPNNFSLRF